MYFFVTCTNPNVPKCKLSVLFSDSALSNLHANKLLQWV